MTAGWDHPAAERLDLVENLHGHPVADPYRWLEDTADPRTVAWVAAQGALFRRERAAWSDREGLAARLVELAAYDTIGLPRPRGDRMFFARRGAGREHPVVAVLGADGHPTVLIDPMRIDPTGSTTLEAWHVSVEGDLLAYQLAGGGTEDTRLRVLDVPTGRVVDGPIDRIRRTPVAWLPGGTAFYYVRRLHPDLVPSDERRFHRRVWLHRIGTDPDEDVPVFGRGRDKADFYGVTVTVDGRWLRVSSTAGAARRTDLWLADLSTTGPERPELQVVQSGVEARTVPYLRRGTGPDDEVLLMTDRDAPFGRLAVSTPSELGGGDWRDLVPSAPPAVLTDFAVLDGEGLDPLRAVVVRAEHAVSTLTVHDLTDGRALGTVPLPGHGSVGHVVDRVEGGCEAWFQYTDFATPPTTYRYDARTGEVHPWGDPVWPDLPAVRTRQVVVDSADGTPVRMFVVSTAGAPDRPRPTILTGYGGFGVTMAPDFSPLITAWVEAGGVYAIANIRGGGEEGEDWHRAGMRAHKQNCFDDVAASADWLVDNGWTSTDQLGLYGASNGGLLVGAALTRFPEKFAAAVCTAPLLDMMRYERFGLGPSWQAEYGTAADPEQAGWLLSYSPYHHVRDGTGYPAVLFAAFDGDDRVDPLHARKMCAALQHASTSRRPVLLRGEQHVGHGVRALSSGVELLTDTLAFFADRLGLPVQHPVRERHKTVRTESRVRRP